MGSYGRIPNIGSGTAWGNNLVPPVNCLTQMGSYDGIFDAQEVAMSGDVTTQEKGQKAAAVRLR